MQVVRYIGHKRQVKAQSSETVCTGGFLPGAWKRLTTEVSFIYSIPVSEPEVTFSSSIMRVIWTVVSGISYGTPVQWQNELNTRS